MNLTAPQKALLQKLNETDGLLEVEQGEISPAYDLHCFRLATICSGPTWYARITFEGRKTVSRMED